MIAALATKSGRNGDGRHWEARLVHRNEKHFLVMDYWSGNNLEGKCFRPFVYAVPAERVREIQLLLESTAEADWDRLSQEVVGELYEFGRQDRLAWASDL